MCHIVFFKLKFTDDDQRKNEDRHRMSQSNYSHRGVFSSSKTSIGVASVKASYFRTKDNDCQ